MNYLAHLHIAYHCQSSLLGNFLGDFIKGNPYGQFPEWIADGVQLHRKIDVYTDQHALIKEIKTRFPESLRRYVPIVVDVFWDHCLSVSWAHFTDISLAEFVQGIEKHMRDDEAMIDDPLPERYISVSRSMWAEQWLGNYGEWRNTCYAIERIAVRRPKLKRLLDCIDVLEQHYDWLTTQFFDFYADVLTYAHKTVR